MARNYYRLILHRPTANMNTIENQTDYRYNTHQAEIRSGLHVTADVMEKHFVKCVSFQYIILH